MNIYICFFVHLALLIAALVFLFKGKDTYFFITVFLLFESVLITFLLY